MNRGWHKCEKGKRDSHTIPGRRKVSKTRVLQVNKRRAGNRMAKRGCWKKIVVGVETPAARASHICTLAFRCVGRTRKKLCLCQRVLSKSGRECSKIRVCFTHCLAWDSGICQPLVIVQQQRAFHRNQDRATEESDRKELFHIHTHEEMLPCLSNLHHHHYQLVSRLH